jgi:predicted RNA-binding protein associated with RNAse of E/G family
MAMHQGIMVDVRAGTHRDRQGRVTPLDALVLRDGGLYVAGRLRENPRFRAFQRWLLPAEGWVVGVFAAHAGQRPMAEEWYIDVDEIVIAGDVWHARDRLLDVSVYEGRRYSVDDADELAECIEEGAITPQAVTEALRSLQRLCRALERLDFSGAALLTEYAPGLPGLQPWDPLRAAGAD